MTGPATRSAPDRRGPLRRIAARFAAVAMAFGLVVAAPIYTPPAEAAVAICDTTLRYGSSGDCVKRLQRRLNELGLNCGNQLTVDGAFGRQTRMRVYAFQGRNRIGVDGVVGPITRGKLRNPSEGLSTICTSSVASRIRAIWPNHLEDKAIRVAKCESGLKVIAVGGPNSNGTLDFGVFQFNNGGTLQAYLPGSSTAIKIDNALHADANIRAALNLYRARGWQPWSCRYA